MKKYAIIVAGGSGSRMKSVVPKQFLEIDGKPMLMHTINAFNQYGAGITIIVVLPEAQLRFWEEICDIHKYTAPHMIALGGRTRFDSVKSGLALIPDEGLVAVHDGVRPFVSMQIIERVFNIAEESGNAVPCLVPKDSVRLLKNAENKSIERDTVRLIQTPQCFRADLLKKAYNMPYDTSYTDDASVISAMGEKINLVEGSPENIKITTTHDLNMAEFLIKLSEEKN